MSKAQMKRADRPVTPEALLEDLWAARRSLALIAGIDLGVFTTIAQNKRTAADVARAAGAEKRRMARLLDALVGMGYLSKRGGGYSLTPLADAFLVRDRESYLGDFAEESRMTLSGWTHLPEVIRTGRPVTALNEAAGREFFPKLVRAIFPLTYNSARILAGSIPQARLKRIEAVLDVAAGTAAWSLPFAQALPQVRITVLDYPEVTPVAREYAERFGVGDRFDYLEGDLRQLDFGQKRYDMVILGHIIHGEGERWGRNLIRRSYRALKPGGLLVIAEMIPNDTRTGPVFPLLFGLNMIIHSSEGDVFTLAEYKHWLGTAGFTGIRTVEVQSPSPVILATHP